MFKRLPTLMMLGLCAAAAITPAAAQQIYQWKDAQGRTHYSSTPPSNGNYSIRGVRDKQPEGNAPAAAPAKPESEQCKQARTNLAVLRDSPSVQMTGSDGNPRTLNDEERAAQMRLAQTILETNCK
ncbi:DUF4124 domain-containing protein [Lysobacteraceae bacterium NML120232]|nr:DUF4124 domain-containing protein [Xanthomonadaceae bacterium NML08-0793]PJK11961.1 DUF4124 domain-containing protein [Xanthomonadaceae bacterium NML120232]